MKLALLRGVSHQQFLATTWANEVAEYMALNIVDPLFIGDRLDTAAAALANVTFNLGRHPDTTATTMSDWMPDYAARLKTKEERQDDEIARALDKWAVAINQNRNQQA